MVKLEKWQKLANDSARAKGRKPPWNRKEHRRMKKRMAAHGYTEYA